MTKLDKMLKMFQYVGPKYVPSEQNVSIPPICILLTPVFQDFSFSFLRQYWLFNQY